MKKLLLLTLTSFTLLFVQAQSPCDSLTVSGSQYQLTLTSVGIIDFWETTAPDGTILGQDSSWNMHSIYNISPSGAPYDTITTCLYTMNTVCCIIYFWNGSSWSIPGNAVASWDCSPNLLGCYDPGTGIGQYTLLSSCQSNCGNVTDSFACMGGVAPGITTCVGPGVYTMGQTNIMSVYSTIAACIADSCNVMPPPSSWDCSPNLLGCYDPGTGLGQYTSMVACQSLCGTPIPSWDCNPNMLGCYDPGTGLGQYTSLAACQSNCGSAASNLCDSMTISGSQYAFTAAVNNINTIIEYWSTTLNNGLTIAEDSMTNTHYCQYGIALDTINVCITYADAAGYYTCCVTWIWDPLLGNWAKMGSVTSILENNSSKKKLMKVVDVLGRETSINSNKTLFFIYEDGIIEKRIVIE